jgi:hypothetical protein
MLRPHLGDALARERIDTLLREADAERLAASVRRRGPIPARPGGLSRSARARARLDSLIARIGRLRAALGVPTRNSLAEQPEAGDTQAMRP